MTKQLPVRPVFPWGPEGPVKPLGPTGPVKPVAPVLPVGPLGPANPRGPVAPGPPTRPVEYELILFKKLNKYTVHGYIIYPKIITALPLVFIIVPACHII